MLQQQTSDGSNAAGREGVSGFFARHGLPPLETRDLCWEFIKAEYQEETIREAPIQGFCSYTLCLDSRPQTILQFRPVAHKLDLGIITAARETYGELVPLTVLIGGLIIRQGREHTISPSPKNPTSRQDANAGKKTSSPSLLVYSLSRIQGISLAEWNSTHGAHTQDPCHRASLVVSFARIIAQGLSASPYPSSCAPKGKVGSSIRHRLEMMQRDLPLRFRPAVDAVLEALPQIEALPWVLIHGDLVPSNIIVDFCDDYNNESGISSESSYQCSCSNSSSSSSPSSSHSSSSEKTGRPTIRGLIDWAEAEYFPFGVGIYGLEEFLGVQISPSVVSKSAVENGVDEPTPSPLSVSMNNDDSGKKYPPPGSKFQYLPNAESLRSLFWAELEKCLRVHFQTSSPPPGEKENKTTNLDQEPLPPTFTADEKNSPSTWSEFFSTVKLARTLGILLWHGIAFDDGRLDRVVCEGRDDEEIQRLDMHLL